MRLNTLSAMLAMGAPPAGTQQNPTGEGLKMLGMMVFFGVVMYLVMIRPQQKKAKQQAAMLKAIKRGDKVCTSGGLIGLVENVKDKTVILKSEGSKLEVLKSAIAEVMERSGDSSAS